MYLPKINERLDPLAIAMKFALINLGSNFRSRTFIHNIETNHNIVILDLHFYFENQFYQIKNIAYIILDKNNEVTLYSHKRINRKIKRFLKKKNES